MREYRLIGFKNDEISWHTKEESEKYTTYKQIIKELKNVLESGADELILHIKT